MQVQKESWVLPDGTRVQKICHTIARCRKTTFPFSLDSWEMPDIVEIRCNVEVHEQAQDNEDMVSYDDDDDDIDHEAYQTSIYLDSFEINTVSSTSIKSYSDLDTQYHFSRIAGNHVEIHYNFAAESKQEDFCRFVPIHSYLIPEEKSVCSAAVTIVNNKIM